MANLNFPVDKLNLPTANLPNANLPLNDLGLDVGDLKMPSLGSTDFQNLELPTDLKGINQSLPFSKTEGLQEWQGKISSVTDKTSMLKDVKANPDKVIETASSNIGQVGDVQKVLNTNALDQSEYGASLKM